MKRRNLFKRIGAMFLVPFLPKPKEAPILNKLNQPPINPSCLSEKQIVYFYANDQTFQRGDVVAPRTDRKKQVRVLNGISVLAALTTDPRMIGMYQGEYYGPSDMYYGFTISDSFVLDETDWVKMWQATGDAAAMSGSFRSYKS